MTNKKLTKEQAAIIGLYTGITCGSFSDIHKLAQEVLGRPIFTHEFACKFLNAELKEKIKPMFLEICYDEDLVDFEKKEVTKIENALDELKSRKKMKNKKPKIYENFQDKFGNVYQFSNYLDFATFWFNGSYRSNVIYFPNNFKKLQAAATTSKEAKEPWNK